MAARPLRCLFTSCLALFVTVLVGCGGGGDESPAEVAVTGPAAAARFANPIVAAAWPTGSADPSVVFHDGFYYYCRVVGGRAIGVARASRLQDIGTVAPTIVWSAPAGTAYSEEVWAPELQYLAGRWYIYFAASDGSTANHRLYVLEAATADPQRGYGFRGKIAAPQDEWAIDGITIESAGQLYFVWSGWRRSGDGFPQVAYIAAMSNPWTISGDRHEIAAPDQPWERSGGALLEAPAVLYRGGRIFLAYSSSGSWTDDYALGLLTYSGGDILDARSWAKSPAPLFVQRADGGAYGPGHAAFVKSPDGSEDWIVYHAIDVRGGGWSRRSVRAQRFDWGGDGMPRFGVPVPAGMPIAEPSGTRARDLGVTDAPLLPELAAPRPWAVASAASRR